MVRQAVIHREDGRMQAALQASAQLRAWLSIGATPDARSAHGEPRRSDTACMTPQVGRRWFFLARLAPHVWHHMTEAA
jgi:hypothetical protein